MRKLRDFLCGSAVLALTTLATTLALTALVPGFAGVGLAAGTDGLAPEKAAEAAAEAPQGPVFDPAATLEDRVSAFVDALEAGDDAMLAQNICLPRLRDMAIAEGQATGIVAAGADIAALGQRYDAAYLARVHDVFDPLVAGARDTAASGGTPGATAASGTSTVATGGILGGKSGGILSALNKGAVVNPMVRTLDIATVSTADLLAGERAPSDAKGDAIAVTGAVRLTLAGDTAARDIPVVKIAGQWCLNPVSVSLIDLVK